MRTFGGGLVQAFTLFVPKAIKADVVPPAIRDAVAAGMHGRNVNWYAAEPAGSGLFTAVDYETDDPPGRFLRLTLWEEDAGGARRDDGGGQTPSILAEVTVPLRFELPFRGSGRGTAVGPGGGRVEGLAAGGWAWDIRVVAVAGTTASGEEVRAKPVNGCWLLVSSSPGESGWRQFRALDERGKVMYGEEV
jgi:hypothetical protein